MCPEVAPKKGGSGGGACMSAPHDLLACSRQHLRRLCWAAVRHTPHAGLSGWAVGANSRGRLWPGVTRGGGGPPSPAHRLGLRLPRSLGRALVGATLPCGLEHKSTARAQGHPGGSSCCQELLGVGWGIPLRTGAGEYAHLPGPDRCRHCQDPSAALRLPGGRLGPLGPWMESGGRLSLRGDQPFLLPRGRPWLPPAAALPPTPAMRFLLQR